MRKKKKDLNAYENDMINISNKEQEILESYNSEYDEYNEKVNYDDEEFDYKNEIEEVVDERVEITTDEDKEEVIEETTPEEIIEQKEVVEETTTEEIIETEEVEYIDNKEINNKKSKTSFYKKIINISFTVIMAILIMIAVDVISVGRYNKGPFFAIETKEYSDGGTKEYIGLGYKVIDYNQTGGRQDKEIGSLSLKYNVEYTEVKDIDLAIEFTADEETAYKKYYKKYLRVESKLESMDFDNNSITFGYIDEGGKYTLKMACNMASETEELVNIDVEEKVYVRGTVTSYEFETDKTSGKLILSDCFATK